MSETWSLPNGGASIPKRFQKQSLDGYEATALLRIPGHQLHELVKRGALQAKNGHRENLSKMRFELTTLLAFKNRPTPDKPPATAPLPPKPAWPSKPEAIGGSALMQLLPASPTFAEMFPFQPAPVAVPPPSVELITQSAAVQLCGHTPSWFLARSRAGVISPVENRGRAFMYRRSDVEALIVMDKAGEETLTHRKPPGRPPQVQAVKLPSKDEADLLVLTLRDACEKLGITRILLDKVDGKWRKEVTREVKEVRTNAEEL